MNNFTYDRISEFILVGFPGFQDKQPKAIISAIFLIVYIAILIENIFIIVLIIVEEKLHKPMYYFICNLAISGICIGTTIIPKTLVNLMLSWNTISFASCFIQALVYSSAFNIQMHILLAMSYDRVVAICSPLHYASIMTNQLVGKLLAVCWTLPWMLNLLGVCYALRLSYCGPNKLPSCLCNHSTMIKLSCVDYSINDMLGLIIVLTNISFYTFIFIISYTKILISVLKIKSPGGHRKAFKTCGAHLCLLSTTILASAFVYICSRIPSFSTDTRLIVTMVQNFLCPIMNPIVFALMTKEIKESIRKIFRKNVVNPVLSNLSSKL